MGRMLVTAPVLLLLFDVLIGTSSGQVADPLTWLVMDNNNNMENNINNIMDNWPRDDSFFGGQNLDFKLTGAIPGSVDKKSWASGFSGMGKRLFRVVPVRGIRKKRWANQAIRGMWGKRAAAEALSHPLAMDSLSRGLWGKRAGAKSMMSEPFNANSLVGNPFAFTADLTCFYPWCQN